MVVLIEVDNKVLIILRINNSNNKYLYLDKIHHLILKTRFFKTPNNNSNNINKIN